MPALESRVDNVWYVKQAAKGTPTATGAAGVKKGRKVGGDLTVNREDGSEVYADGQRFPDATDYVNTLIGNGNPVIQAQADVTGYLAYLLCGSEAVTGAADPYEHVATPASAAFWTTWWKETGATVGPLKQEFSDARLVSLRIEGSSANKVVKVTPTFVSLTAGKTFSTAPTAVIGTDTPLAYTDGEGRFNIDGSVFTAHSSFAIVIEDAASGWYGDSVVPADVIFGTARVMLEGVTILVDTQGFERYNSIIYGSTAPVAGTNPRRDLPALGSYAVDLRKGSDYTVSLGGPSAGTFTLTYNAQTTAGIAYNATSAAVQSALEALTNVDAGDVTVTGAGGGPYSVKWRRAGVVMTGSGAGLTGGTFLLTDLGTARQLKIEIPGVKWSPDLAIAGDPDGGAVELALAGESRKSGASPMVRVTTRSADPAYS